MKILIVTPIFPPEIGGPATYTTEILKRLPPNPKLTVISFNRFLEALPPSDVYFVTTIGGMVMRQLRLFFTCLKRGYRADIFYLQEPAVVGLSGVVSGKLLGKRVIT